MHDLIFANQRELTEKKFVEHARKLGLDLAQFRNDLKSPEVKAKVDADAKEAANLKITGTPGLLRQWQVPQRRQAFCGI